jgi:cholesterol transport system auxiliary component
MKSPIIVKRVSVRPALLSLLIGSSTLVSFALYGCGSATPPVDDAVTNALAAPMPGTNDPSWLTSRDKLPPPDTDRIEYNAEKRTLTLYDLPGRDRWIVQLPNEHSGHLVGSQHMLPEGVDTSRTLVYYARAGVKVSAPVTVAQIEAGRMSHTSLAIGR